MKTILSYILTPIYMFIFGMLLLIFHPIQIVTRWIWGYPVRKKAVDIMNFGLLYSLYILGARITSDIQYYRRLKRDCFVNQP